MSTINPTPGQSGVTPLDTKSEAKQIDEKPEAKPSDGKSDIPSTDGKYSRSPRQERSSESMKENTGSRDQHNLTSSNISNNGVAEIQDVNQNIIQQDILEKTENPKQDSPKIADTTENAAEKIDTSAQEGEENADTVGKGAEKTDAPEQAAPKNVDKTESAAEKPEIVEEMTAEKTETPEDNTLEKAKTPENIAPEKATTQEDHAAKKTETLQQDATESNKTTEEDAGAIEPTQKSAAEQEDTASNHAAEKKDVEKDDLETAGHSPQNDGISACSLEEHHDNDGDTSGSKFGSSSDCLNSDDGKTTSTQQSGAQDALCRAVSGKTIIDGSSQASAHTAGGQDHGGDDDARDDNNDASEKGDGYGDGGDDNGDAGQLPGVSTDKDHVDGACSIRTPSKESFEWLPPGITSTPNHSSLRIPSDSGLGETFNASNSLQRENVTENNTPDHTERNQLTEREAELRKSQAVVEYVENDRDRLKETLRQNEMRHSREMQDLQRQSNEEIERLGVELHQKTEELHASKVNIDQLNQEKQGLAETMKQKETSFSKNAQRFQESHKQSTEKIQRLEVELRQKTEELCASNKKIDELKQEKQGLADTMRQKEMSFLQEGQRFQESHRQLTKDIEKFRAELHQKKEELCTSNRHISQLIQEKDELTKTLEQTEMTYSQEVQRLQDCLQQSSENIERLNGEILRKSMTHSQEILNHNDRHRQLTEVIEKLRGDIETLRGQLLEKDNYYYGLNASLTRAVQEKEQAVEQKRQIVTRLQNANNEKDRLQEMLTATHQNTIMSRTVVIMKTALCRKYRAISEQLERENRELQNRCQDIRRMCDAHQISLRDALNRGQEIQDTLTNEREHNQRDRDQLKGKVYDLKQELGQLQTTSQEQITGLTEERDNAQAEYQRRSGALRRLEEEKEQWDEERMTMRENVRRLERHTQELETNARVLETHRQTAQDQSVSFGQQTATYLAQNAQLQAVCQDQATTMTGLRDQLRQKTDQVLPLEVEARRATQETQNMRAQLNAVKQENRNLDTTVNALRGEIQRNTDIIREYQRTEETHRTSMANAQEQKMRYVRETQEARRQNNILQAEIQRLRRQLD